MNLAAVTKILKKNKSFLITTHVNPDPDALSSELALALFLKSQGKEVSVVNEEKVPSRFLFLPKSTLITSIKNYKARPYDVAIVVDCGDLDRIGRVKKLMSLDKMIINIDHHITNDRFGDINLVNPQVSSAAEIMYDLLQEANCRMTKDIATLLYLGIMTDTGSFRYETTTPHCHTIAAELMKFDISISQLYRVLYESVPLQDLKGFTKIVSRFDSFYKGKVLCVELPKKVLNKFSQDFDLRDKIFGFLRTVKGVEVVMIVTEENAHQTRINLRSQGSVDVAKLASHFQGGGHSRASGCLIEGNMKVAQKKILDQLKML